MRVYRATTQIASVLFIAAVVGSVASSAAAQPPAGMPAPPAQRSLDDDTPYVSDSRVGYVDGAIPGSQVRVRFDNAYNSRQPNRAEYIYAKGGPGTPGFPVAESGIDYQDMMAYIEHAWSPACSAFVEIGTRFINPDVNDNSAGLGDMNAGFKHVLFACGDVVASFQFRTYIPSGDAKRGLGTDHVSIEPSLLVYRRWQDWLNIEGELRYWQPIGGTNFSGELVRYGIGASYNALEIRGMTVSPVVEFVGWSVLDGFSRSLRSNGTLDFQEADGDTIVNVKAGLRVRIGCNKDVYVGYGHALTGDQWYDDIARLELRWLF